jgi:recombination protein RecA
MAKTDKTTDTVNTNSEKFKALKLTMDKIEKDYGKGSVMMMGSNFHRLSRS